MVNNWKGFVTDELVQFLERWVEYYICHNMKYRALPTESQRHIFHLSRNSKGRLCYDIEILVGQEIGYCTTPHRHNKLDEFTYAFRSLESLHQMAIIGHIDPCDELQDKDMWKAFLNRCECRNNSEFERLLFEAMRSLQDEAERRELVEKTGNKVRTWDCIALLLEVSIPTAKKLAIDAELPIRICNGAVECDKNEVLEKVAKYKLNRLWCKSQQKSESFRM